MSSILDNIETTLDNGTSMVIAEKIFARVLFKIIENRNYPIEYMQLWSDTPELILNRTLAKEVNSLMQCTIKDLYEIYLLDENEIRHLCGGRYVNRVQDNANNYYTCNWDKPEYNIIASYNVNLDNAIHILTGGDIVIHWKDKLTLLSEIDESHQKPIRNWITNAHLEFSEDFYEDLKKYCCKNFESMLNSFNR